MTKETIINGILDVDKKSINSEPLEEKKKATQNKDGSAEFNNNI